MFNEEDGVWRTIGGRRVFIRTGQSMSDAMKESGKFSISKNKYKEVDDKALKEMDINTIRQRSEMPPEDIEALQNYAGRGYEEIQDTLTLGEPRDWSKYKNIDEVKADIDRLDKVLKNSKIDSDIIAYKGTLDSHYKDFKIGDEFEAPTFYGTSLKKGVADRFATMAGLQSPKDTKAIVEVRIPKGANGHYMGDYYSSGNTNEFEVLLPRNQRFKLIGKKVIDPSYEEDGIYHRKQKYVEYIVEVVNK